MILVDFDAIDKELDNLNSCMDALENQSTSLHEKVKEFLENVKCQRDVSQMEDAKE